MILDAFDAKHNDEIFGSECGVFVRSTLYLRALRINFVRPFVRPFVLLRKIITFCEGDMDPVTHHMSTGSLKLDILGSRK